MATELEKKYGRVLTFQGQTAGRPGRVASVGLDVGVSKMIWCSTVPKRVNTAMCHFTMYKTAGHQSGRGEFNSSAVVCLLWQKAERSDARAVVDGHVSMPACSGGGKDQRKSAKNIGNA